MLGKSVQRVQDALISRGIDGKILDLPTSTRTAEEAAATIGCQVAQILKSLVFRTKETNQPILVLASGINRVNEKRVAQELGEEIVKADAEFIREKTGFAIGGIPPVGHIQKIRTFIDQDLLLYPEIWAAAGTPHAVFKLDSAIIERLTDGKIISVK